MPGKLWVSMSVRTTVWGKTYKRVFECENENEAQTIVKLATLSQRNERVCIHEKKPFYNPNSFITNYLDRETHPDWYPVEEEQR